MGEKTNSAPEALSAQLKKRLTASQAAETFHRN
jgi:hypothetical protein